MIIFVGGDFNEEPEDYEEHVPLFSGRLLCYLFGHQWEWVRSTPNMHFCYRCQEPGWWVPSSALTVE